VTFAKRQWAKLVKRHCTQQNALPQLNRKPGLFQPSAPKPVANCTRDPACVRQTVMCKFGVHMGDSAKRQRRRATYRFVCGMEARIGLIHPRRLKTYSVGAGRTFVARPRPLAALGKLRGAGLWRCLYPLTRSNAITQTKGQPERIRLSFFVSARTRVAFNPPQMFCNASQSASAEQRSVSLPFHRIALASGLGTVSPVGCRGACA